MKILIVQDYLRSGGTERQSVLLANAFAAAGHPTTLLTFRPGGALDPTVAAGVNRRSAQAFDWHLDWFAPGLGSEVSRVRPDVVLCMGRMANCFALRMRDDTTGRRVVATMRTGKALPWLFRRSLARVHHIVANSHDARDTLVKSYGLAPGKISVIHNSLVFPPAPAARRDDALRAQHGASPSTTVLLNVAMFRREKNQRELVAVVAALPRERDWQLWFAGEGPERAGCEQLVAEAKLAERVKFLGFQRDPSRLYAAADLAVHASWSEALSNFLIEAQARGLPAVAFEAQGIRECFLPERTGWAIARGDHEAFRAAVLRFLDLTGDQRRAIASTARAYARETFDPPQQVTAYLELFGRLHGAGR